MTDPHSLVVDKEDCYGDAMLTIRGDGCATELRVYNFMADRSQPRVSLGQIESTGKTSTVWLSPAHVVLLADLFTEWLATRNGGA